MSWVGGWVGGVTDGREEAGGAKCEEGGQERTQKSKYKEGVKGQRGGS